LYLCRLKSAELKVLLVVIRQTLGWIDRNSLRGRKETDWISGSQLRQKTGCSSRAITYAIEQLVTLNLIEILDDNWHRLDTPEKRKGKPRLYFRLTDHVYKHVENYVDMVPTTAIFAEDYRKNVTGLAQKMRITKETLQN
jgi:hypothetical protein